MPRSKALCMRAMASVSVNLPHHPVETVHIPNPTSETFKFDLRRTRYFIKEGFYTARIWFGKFDPQRTRALDVLRAGRDGLKDVKDVIWREVLCERCERCDFWRGSGKSGKVA